LVIAQVFRLGPAPEGVALGPPPAARAAMKETRAADGCEGLYLLASRNDEDSIAIVLWRDESALNAMRQRESEQLDEIRAENPDMPDVQTSALYDVISADD
jgi:quinol monooxygenase YgiN